jgi:DNA polymerase-3 subunit chi
MSVRVDFYVLAQANETAGLQFACKLAEKAYRHKQRMYVYCADQATAHRFDELLWTFDDISFVPHLLQGETAKYPPAINIGYSEPQASYPLILNLSHEIPAFYSNSKRVMEIVFGDETQRAATRERFKQYRADSCDMHTHQMDKY